MLCKVNQYMCVYQRIMRWNKPNPSSVLISHCLWFIFVFSHQGSSHLCLLQENILSRVCFSKTSLHLCAPAKHYLTQPTFQRTRSFGFTHIHQSLIQVGCTVSLPFTNNSCRLWMEETTTAACTELSVLCGNNDRLVQMFQGLC